VHRLVAARCPIFAHAVFGGPEMGAGGGRRVVFGGVIGLVGEIVAGICWPNVTRAAHGRYRREPGAPRFYTLANCPMGCGLNRHVADLLREDPSTASRAILLRASCRKVKRGCAQGYNGWRDWGFSTVLSP